MKSITLEKIKNYGTVKGSLKNCLFLSSFIPVGEERAKFNTGGIMEYALTVVKFKDKFLELYIKQHKDCKPEFKILGTFPTRKEALKSSYTTKSLMKIWMEKGEPVLQELLAKFKNGGAK